MLLEVARDGYWSLLDLTSSALKEDITFIECEARGRLKKTASTG